MFPKLPWSGMSRREKRVWLSIAAGFGWFILFPSAVAMLHDGILAYGAIICVAVLYPLIGGFSMRPQKEKLIYCASEEEKQAAEQKFECQRRTKFWLGGGLLFILVLGLVALLGWVGVLLLCGTFGQIWLQIQLDIRRGSKLWVFIIFSIINMAGVVFIINLAS